ncbi:putative nucleolar gtp-binding protein 2 [Botryosphaeria dothidea]|uniref:Nucleolar gtp-binding protein 2 n=1 Tax=Botryosphaeria dothidea TaxID=55169 RepID=A0A8H4IUI3_9PEZI|nr:putative nucleolar gtp-binding protein 2 [Botryosphaeria dothidea]
MKVGKPKSKRVPVRLRHKIEKASAAKQRKARKDAKKKPEWRSKIKKDPGIPNLFPYKDKLLAEIEEKKRLKEEDQVRRREEARARKLEKGKEAASANDEEDMDDLEDGEDMIDYEASDDDAMDEGNSSNPMAALLASARARAAEFEAEREDEEMDEDDDGWTATGDDGSSAPTARKDSSRKAFDKIFKQVVESADVVLYVLDARDPEGTRSKEVERQVMSAAADKRLILILNKIDLVPPPVLKGWLTHLRRYFPTIPLRASNPAPAAKTFDHKQLTVKGTSEALFKALKSYAQSKQLKRSISVGVIGYPNVGKSSVINALTSRIGNRQACPTGAEAGVTTSLREVKLDNKLKLLDSPGIVFPSSNSGSKAQKVEEQARLILLNAIPPKEIDDPIPAVDLLVKRLSASEEMFNKLLAVYDLPALMSSGDITQDFLIHVARKRGRLSRGGVPNLHSAALAVITDWRDGRIQGWMDAPVLQVANVPAPGAPAPEAGAEPVGDQKEIVKEWAAEFKLDGLWGDDENTETMET